MATTPSTGGAGLPIRVRRYAELTPSLRGFIDAAEADGFPVVADFNGPDPGGVGGYPVNVIDGVRQNTGLVYLTDEVRARPNLTISGDVLVDRILVDQGRAVGVITADGAGIAAGEVILSAGSYGSPAILLRSGVGPADDLAALGIDVVADLPLGRRLPPLHLCSVRVEPGCDRTMDSLGRPRILGHVQPPVRNPEIVDASLGSDHHQALVGRPRPESPLVAYQDGRARQAHSDGLEGH
jgi:choline dehydrogenase-like flavoprotein